MKSARFIHRQNFKYMDNSELIVRSTFHISKSPYFCLTERNAAGAYLAHNLTPIVSSSVSPRNLSDEFSYHGDSDRNSERLDVMQHLYSLVKTSISEHMYQEIVDFKLFLSTMLGGSKSPK